MGPASLIQGRRPLAIPPATASAASHRRHRLLPASPLLCLHRLLPLHKPRSPSTHPTRRSRPSCLVEVEARGIDSAPVLRLSPQATDLETVRSASRRRLSRTQTRKHEEATGNRGFTERGGYSPVDEQNEYVLVVGVVGNDCVPARLAVTI
uniref:Uncharacterized protein n=1 Tax=Oryza rufipogon TaxID=4529 RepID=A0A0E0RBW4_ORYRU